MKLLIFLMMLSVSAYSQVKKDTVIYNIIYKDTVIYRIVEKVEEKADENYIDLSNWGIGPYAGVDWSYTKAGGGGFTYSFGFGLSYYIWRLPRLTSNKKHRHHEKN